MNGNTEGSTRRRLLDRPGRWWRDSALYRERYGFLLGVKVALTMRRLRHAADRVIFVSLPMIAAAVQVRGGTADVEVLNQIFHHGELNIDFPFEPEYIVDAGANIGMSAVYFANRYPRAEILSLEIDSGNVELLRRNAAPYPQIRVELMGLWSHATKMSIENPADEPWAFRGVEWSPSSTGEPIDTMGVSEILRTTGWPRIDLLKIDIEGGEVEVFSEGSERWIDNVRAIAVELHDRMRPGCSESLDRAVAGHDFTGRQFGEYRVLVRHEADL
jgi:FkbM family methyltransferase